MKKIIIVGGGFGGAYCARKLENDFDVTLIDTKDYFEFTPGILRTLVEPWHVKKIQVMHNHYLKHVKFYRGRVKKISYKFVYFNNKKLNYDYLIIASGSRYSAPFKSEDIVNAARTSDLRKSSKLLEKSESILIVGGGVVGVELAGEITDHFKDKKITIVESGHDLISRNPLKARTYAEKILKKNNVTINFNENVIGNKDSIFFTNKENEFKPDVAFLCIGITPNSSFMRDLFSKKLSERGHIMVNEFLQLDKNIFVIGDACGIKEEKTAQNSENHAKIVIENIKNIENNKPLIKYENKPRVMIISLGRFKGILNYKNFTFTGFIPGLLKSFVEWKTMRRYR